MLKLTAATLTLRPVRRRIQYLMVFFAWFMATGSQWDVMQVVAWGKMFADYSQGMTLSAAAKKTFSGEMCSICLVVQDGRKQQESSGDKLPQGKISSKMLDLCPLAVAVSVFAPEREQTGTMAAVLDVDGRGRVSPPVPPPRV